MQLHLSRSEFQLDKLHQQDDEKDARTKGEERIVTKSKADVQPDFRAATSSSSTVQLRRKIGGHSGHSVNLIGGVQGDL